MNVNSELTNFSGVCRLFPLPGVVLFPHVVLSLHIFEPRYRQMMEHALAGDGLICIVQTQSGSIQGKSGEPALESIAGLGRVIAHERLPDGRFNLLLLGVKRVRLNEELEVETLYRQAAAEVMEDEEGEEGVELEEAKREELKLLFRQLLEQVGGLDPDTERLISTELSVSMLTDVAAHTLGLPAQVKQALLEEPRVQARLDYLLALLRKTLQRPEPREPRPNYPPRFSDN